MTSFKLPTAAATLAATCLAVAAPTQIRLGPEGEILAWLVAGPFPNVGALELKGTGFATDYLAGEASATAVEHRVIPMIPFERDTDPNLRIGRKPGWRLGIGDLRSGIDLGQLLNGGKPGIAYLYTELDSPRDVDAKLLFGSDDGAKVWLNGEQRFVKQVARGITRDEDTVTLHLRQGVNRLLFKIEQGNGGWGLLARVVGSDGKPIPSLAQTLDIEPAAAGTGAEGWLRRAVGKPGSFDLLSAIQYEERSAKAALWLSRFRNEADQPKRLDDALSADRRRALVDAARSANDLSTALRDAAQSVEQEYQRARLPLLRETQLARPMVSANVKAEDYVRAMPGGRYFVHANGKPFIPIGYNHNPDWAKFVEADPLFTPYKPGLPDEYMAHLKASGVNVVRMMIETPQSGNLEEPIGLFRPEHVRWIDTVFMAARKHGIKLIVTPWDTFWMNKRWELTPYNPDNGGIVKQRLEFITSPKVREQQKRRLKFMIDRWGNMGDIFAWELLNEADIWWGANAAQLTEWTNDMATYVRSYEKQRWGRNHMLSVSFAEAMPKGDMAHLAYDSSQLDYATTHLYIGASKAPTEAVGPGLAIQQGVRYAMAEIDDNRPYMDTENGPIDRWIESAVLDAEVFHNMTWAHLASGAAGSGFRWPYRHPHHLTEKMLEHLKHFATFVDKVDWTALAGKRVKMEATGTKGAATCGFATGRSAMAWTSAPGPISIRWAEGPATAKARLFDTQSGRWLKDVKVRKKGDSYEIVAPGVASLAVVLTKA